MAEIATDGYRKPRKLEHGFGDAESDVERTLARANNINDMIARSDKNNLPAAVKADVIEINNLLYEIKPVTDAQIINLEKLKEKFNEFVKEFNLSN